MTLSLIQKAKAEYEKAKAEYHKHKTGKYYFAMTRAGTKFCNAKKGL